MNVRSVLLGALLAASLLGCDRVRPPGDGAGAALMRRLLLARRLEIVVEEHELRDPLERAARRLAEASADARFDAFVVDGSSAGDTSIPRIVAGTRGSNHVWMLASRTGFVSDRSAESVSFRFADEVFADPADGFTATFQDPDRPGLPVTVVYGNSPAAVAWACGSVEPGWQPWLRITHGGQIVRECRLRIDGAPFAGEWTTRSRARAAREAGKTVLEGVGTGLVVHVTPGVTSENARAYSAACARARESARGWCGPEGQIGRTDVWLFASAAAYLEEGDANALSEIDPLLGRVDALVLGAHDDGGAGAALAAAWAALGAPAEPWMNDAAGTEAAWSWWGRALDPWLARVTSGGRPVRLGEVVSARGPETTSRHVLAPLRAACWRWLREIRGEAFVRELWRGTRALEVDAEADRAFALWLAARSKTVAVRRVAPREGEVLRAVGACDFDAPDGRGRPRGFGTYGFEEAVDVARTSGADTLLVAAYTCDRPGAPRRFGDTRARLFAPREGDVRIAAALFAGTSRGLRTALAANLLSGDGGTWSGTWTRGDEAGWSVFFDRYSAFVEHHAALAELTGATLLSIGTALEPVTSTQDTGRRPNPHELAWKRAGWTRVIATARRSFDGLLTYTSGSVLELESVPFYGELDLVALELSPTLDLDDLSDDLEARVEIGAAIDAALAALETKARALNKRALLGEVCFSPVLEGAARRLGRDHTSVDWQAQQYLDLGERLKAWSGTPLCAGVVAWRIGTGTAEPDPAPVISTQRVRDAVRLVFDALPAR